MSTWLSFSLPNPFSDDDDGAGGEDQDNGNANYGEPFTHRHPQSLHSPNSTPSPTAGVKQDLSVLSQSFSQQLRGVAAFLAPPPSTAQPLFVNDSYLSDKDSSSVRMTASSPVRASNETMIGIKKDLAEIGGGFKALFSSSSSGISKFASNFLQFQGDDNSRDGQQEEDDQEDEDDDLEEDIPGINVQVLDFVQKISLSPELWTDFPFSLPFDFKLSDFQKEHAATIEVLVPSILTLRRTCDNLSDGQFWMIYFILLLPRLNEIDSKLLSTSQIVEVRETLLEKLQNKKDKNVQKENSGFFKIGIDSTGNEPVNAAQDHNCLSKTADISPEKASSTGCREVETVYPEKSLKHEYAGENMSLNDLKDTEDMDMDDVSFSDLEDDDNDSSDRVSSFRPTQSGRASSASESNEWVRLNENSGAQGIQNKSGLPNRHVKDSEGEDSSDWITVDDSDTDTLPGAV